MLPTRVLLFGCSRGGWPYLMLQCYHFLYLRCISCPMDLQCPIKAVTINQSINRSINEGIVASSSAAQASTFSAYLSAVRCMGGCPSRVPYSPSPIKKLHHHPHAPPPSAMHLTSPHPARPHPAPPPSPSSPHAYAPSNTPIPDLD